MNQMEPGFRGHHPGSGNRIASPPRLLENDTENRIYQKRIVTGPHLQPGCIQQPLAKAELLTHLIYNQTKQSREELHEQSGCNESDTKGLTQKCKER